MLDINRHINNLKAVRNILEEKYRKAQDEKEKMDILSDLMGYKLIQPTDERLSVFKEYNQKSRDVRKGSTKYIGKCPYITHYKKSIEIPVEIQARDGVRSYKETTWKVKYPKCNTYVLAEEVSDIESVKDFADMLKDMAVKNGCEYADIMNESNFKNALSHGYWLIYKLRFKNLTDTRLIDCGYVLVEKDFSKKEFSVDALGIIDNKIIKSKSALPHIVLQDCIEAIKKSVMNEHKTEVKKREKLKDDMVRKSKEAKKLKESKKENKEELISSDAADAMALASILSNSGF